MIKAVFLNFVAYDENTSIHSLSSLVVKDFFKEKMLGNKSMARI